MATTVAKGQPVELTSHTPVLMDVEMDPSAQSSEPDEDLYIRLKTLQRQLEFYEIQVGQIRLVIFTRVLFSVSLSRRLCQVQLPAAYCCNSIDLHAGWLTGLLTTMQEEYIKEEQRSLKRELLRAQEEVKRIQAVPLVIGQFLEMIDRNSGIIGSTTGSNYYVRILSTLNRELLKPSSSVALHRHSNALVDILPPEADSSISLLSQSERPDVTYQVCQLHTAHTQQLTCMQPVSPSTRASCRSALRQVRIDAAFIIEPRVL